MFIPEYTITNRILDNVAEIERVRSIAQLCVILPSWKARMRKEAKIEFFKVNLNLLGIRADLDEIKKYLDGMEDNPANLVKNIKASIETAQKLSQSYEIDEETISLLYQSIIGSEEMKIPQMYRKRATDSGTNPEEILSDMTELIDWLNSMDCRETHPLIRAAIVKGRIAEIKPFQNYNDLMSNLLAHQMLENSGYNLDGYCHLEISYAQDPIGYKRAIRSPSLEEDYTIWIDFYTEAMARKASSKREEILLSAKDTKIAQAKGRAKLSGRQEKIITYLHDYGMIKNKDFAKLFPKISEDTVLRDLKDLIEREMIVKKGRTKASRYELR